MKTGKVLACLAGMVVMMVGSAYALLYLDLNGDHTGPVWMSQSSNPSETWVFNLDTDALVHGDIEPEDIILSATLKICFTDDDNDCWSKEYTDIKLDGTRVVNNMEVDPGYYTANVLSWVTDHLLYVKLCDVRGDFGVSCVKVYGCYEDVEEEEPEPEPVIPEPATLGMIAIGMCGLGIMRRRRVRR